MMPDPSAPPSAVRRGRSALVGGRRVAAEGAGRRGVDRGRERLGRERAAVGLAGERRGVERLEHLLDDLEAHGQAVVVVLADHAHALERLVEQRSIARQRLEVREPARLLGLREGLLRHADRVEEHEHALALEAPAARIAGLDVPAQPAERATQHLTEVCARGAQDELLDLVLRGASLRQVVVEDRQRVRREVELDADRAADVLHARVGELGDLGRCGGNVQLEVVHGARTYFAPRASHARRGMGSTRDAPRELRRRPRRPAPRPHRRPARVA